MKNDWTTYTGEESSLPREFLAVLIHKPTDPMLGVFSGYYPGNDSCVVRGVARWGVHNRVLGMAQLEVGDRWCHYPEPPE